MPIASSRPRGKRVRLALAAALVAAGCSGGGGCGTSCGGAFKTVGDQGHPIRFTGARLDNVAQVRLTRSGFNFLNASHLNEILGALNSGAGLSMPCIEKDNLLDACLGSFGLRFSILAGDTNFDGSCDGADATPLHIAFKDVSWILVPPSTLRAHIVMHLKTGDIYLRTKEEHSTLCGGTSAIQLRAFYDDELPGLPAKDTVVDLDLGFSTAPDGRLEINFPNASLDAIVGNFQPGALWLDGNVGTDPPIAANAVGNYFGNGCDSSARGSYAVTKNGGAQLSCSQVFTDLSAGCDPNGSNGALCGIVQYVRGYLFDYLKNHFASHILGVLRAQLDNLRCQRASDSQSSPVACDGNHPCPADDDGHALACDTARGVCYPPAAGAGNFNCEPIALAIAGQLDVSHLTEKVGFPPETKLDIFAGLGSKGAAGIVDGNGLQLSAQAGTAPASPLLSLCVPPVQPAYLADPPPMDFEANKPAGVTSYDAAFSLASAMLNRGFLDAYHAGLLCVAVTHKTTPYISSGLFKIFLPSLGLVTGDRAVPMNVLFRPTQAPYLRVGRNTTKVNADGSITPDDPLLTLTFKQLEVDFYALVDERQVRLFTLQADLQLPLGIRTFAEPNTDTLQPVLGGLETLLTNVSALSPDGGPYGQSDLLAEDPGALKDLLGAVVRLAQPLLAGVIKPMVLPTMLGLRFAVEGVAGGVPMTDLANGGYHHLALWANVNECGSSCATRTVRTEARAASARAPASLEEGRPPALELELFSQARSAEFSYRVDGSLWSPWIGNVSRLTIRDPLFLLPGHHLVEVTSREAGDDRTMDREPAAVDFAVN